MLRTVKTILIFCAVFSAFIILPAPVHGAPVPVDLELGGAGADAWNITNIKPGDSGVEMLTVRNAGYANGVLVIWVTDVVDSGVLSPSVVIDPGESAQLSKHVLFTIMSNRLASNIALPATLGNFPSSAGDAARITVSPIAPGETIDITWQWRLPVTAGNAVQGKKLTFTINYMLEELPAAPVPGGDNAPIPTKKPDSPLIVTSPGKQIILNISENGEVSETQTIEIISGLVTLSLERGTVIRTVDNKAPTEFRITVREIPPPPPSGMVFIGPVYELTFYVDSGPQPVSLSEPVRLVFNYDMTELPDNVTAMFMATWDDELGWTQLTPISGFISEEGLIGGLAYHFSTFSIIAQVESDEPVTTPPVITLPPVLLPARFEIYDLTISEKQVDSGEPVTVRVHVANTGEISGEHLITLTINDMFIESKLVTLAPGQNRNVSFIVSPYHEGTYVIEVNGLTENLVVTGEIIPDEKNSFWPTPGIWIIAGAVTVIILVVVRYLIKKRRRT